MILYLNRTTTPLIRAANSNDLEEIKSLVLSGAKIYQDDHSVLRICCQNGNLEAAKFLVEHGANINANNGDCLRLSALRDNWM